MAIDLGDIYRCGFTNFSPSGAAVTATAMTVTIDLPDGTATSPVTVTAGSPGVYQYDYQTVQAGRHVQRWLGTGTNPGAFVDAFDVRPANAPYITSLADAKNQLNITKTDTDEDVRSKLEATTGIVENELGQAVVRRPFTEEHNVGSYLVLNWHPVVQLLSIVGVDGTVWDVANYHVSNVGVVTPIAGSLPTGRVVVTYVAGMSIIPRNYTEAAIIILQNLWDTRRGSRGGPRPGGGEAPRAAGASYALPNQAKDLLGGGIPGVA